MSATNIHTAYDFWAKNVRTRIGDPRLRDLLAPLEPPHPFGVKRPCLEQTYYEQFNRPNVDVVDIKNNPIVGFTSKGIKLQDGTVHEFDVVVIATGFDITTGGMTSMGLKNIDGVTLQSQWKKAAYTYLGTTIAGYPNMFHLYGETNTDSVLPNSRSAWSDTSFQRSDERRSTRSLDRGCY